MAWLLLAFLWLTTLGFVFLAGFALWQDWLLNRELEPLEEFEATMRALGER
jgi:hypothetical protein